MCSIHRLFTRRILYDLAVAFVTDLNSADVGILLLSRTVSNYCGLAWINPVLNSRRYLYGLVMNNCGTYVTGHELGHIYGSNHDREEENAQNAGGSNYGNLIDVNGRPSGYNTIMA